MLKNDTPSDDFGLDFKYYISLNCTHLLRMFVKGLIHAEGNHEFPNVGYYDRLKRNPKKL